MKPDASPLDTLRTLATRGASGELICASPECEVHVYFQNGRLAWATDSEHPFAFTRRLQKTAQLDADAFRDILDSCRRERRPLGETLVSWGVASWDEVRDALRHQIVLAVDVLRRSEGVQTLFLDRTHQYAKYESGLTFELSDLFEDDEEKDAQAKRDAAREASAARAKADAGLARRLLETADGALWAEVHEGPDVVDAAPEPAPGPRFAMAFAERSVRDGAELVALRSPEGTLAGTALPGGRALWCRLAPHATVGAAVSWLAVFSGERSNVTREVAPVDGEASAEWALGHDEGVTSELTAFLARAPEIVAALTTDLDDPAWHCGAGRVVAPGRALDVTHRRGRVLAVEAPFGEDRRIAVDPDDVGFRFRTLVTRERDVWCFGAEVGARSRKILWLLLDRRASQGIGWAYLTSLSRHLVHLRPW